MNKLWYIVLCIGVALHADIEIKNQSEFPFKITSATYEQSNGLQKTPAIELGSLIVAPHASLHMPFNRREAIRSLTGVHAGRTYTFDLPIGIQGAITITPENRVILTGPTSINPGKEFDIKLPKKNSGIRAL